MAELKEIQLRDAKAQLSHVLDEAIAGAPAVITRHGKREGVIMSYKEYERLSRVPNLGWLLTHSPLQEGDIQKRKPARALRDEELF